jgi:hypothetical protein
VTRARNAGVALTLLLAMVGGYVNFSQPTPIPLKADLAAFPSDIGPWKRIEAPNYDHVYDGLGVDRDMSRFYRADSGQIVQLYIGYFESQTQGKELISYKLNDLFDGARTIELGIGGGRELAVNERIVTVRDRERITRFWYIINAARWPISTGQVVHGGIVDPSPDQWCGDSGEAEVYGPDEQDDVTNSDEFIRAISPLVI